ncbi:MAG TPA: S8 family serine peptidase [Thermoanaerobaculia bacterium]|nr:S8 family serine peptidase [Thermoanaerobaculia bacterium]
MRKMSVYCAALWALTVFLAAPSWAADSFIVECHGSCAGAAEAVRAIPGAQVERVFANVPGMVISVPREALAALRARADVAAVSEDVQLLSSDPSDETPLSPAAGAEVLTPAQLTAPVGTDYNHGLTGAATLHAQGRLGTGVVVAVLDSGVANNPAAVPALAGSVLGGESFVPASFDPVLSATSTQNDPHGTFAATLIAGHARFQFPTASPLIQSLLAHAPASVISCALLGCPAGNSVVSLTGVAPAAQVYAMKMLPSDGEAGRSAWVLAAMDRAITLRLNWDAGMPAVPVNPGCGAENTPCVYDSLPIQVANLSFGGPTLFAGGSVRDLLVAEMLEAGIVPVTSAGNDGPAALTVNSPGSGPGALNVASASSAAHERLRRDLELGPGAGLQVRPFSGIQTQPTSSRGPTPDGRWSIELTAEGFANFAQAADGHLSLVSGTSFSAPLAAGAAALLRGQFPAASAAKIRNAIAQGANPALLADGSGRIDQGNGYLNVPAAASLLASGKVKDKLPKGPESHNVTANLRTLGIQTVKFHHDRFTQRIEGLLPGQVAHLFVPIEANDDRLTVSITGVTPAMASDKIALTVVDAFTSFASPRVSAPVDTDTTFTVDAPQSGLIRVAVQGASSNAGLVSCDVTLERRRVDLGPPLAVGTVQQDGDELVQFQVAPGTGEISFLLSFKHDWGAWPVNDIDLILEDPNGNFLFDGATSNTPERVTVIDPTPGTWTAHVQGFTLNTSQDSWKLWGTADGVGLE